MPGVIYLSSATVSEPIKHECGLAAIRLLKPLSHYREKYGSALWGLNRMYLLLEKQHNRGQDGAGLACMRLGLPPGQPYVAIEKLTEPAPPWQTLIQRIENRLAKMLELHPNLLVEPQRLKALFPFAGELLMGHLRYATHGNSGVNACHPVIRANNWQTRTLVMAGNFNLTNNAALFRKLVELGQHPVEQNDTTTVLERLGHFLDSAVEQAVQRFKQDGLDNKAITRAVIESLDPGPILEKTAKLWDGGYLLGGMIGSGDFFAMRDPNGIRPGYYFADDEVAVVASERQAIATALNRPYDDIREIPRGNALIIKANGKLWLHPFIEQGERKACSFERIYFSRGNDAAIYEERKELGRVVVPRILEAIDHDLNHTVFSYVPNTAQVAFWGMLKGLEDHLNEQKIASIAGKELSEAALRDILQQRVRVENVVLKDTKMRTFITNDAARDSMAAHVYDITYGTVEPGVDNLVAIDDSIVRGTTLRQSILRILNRLHPRKIIIVSSAPQIRYPDCYGIDMSQIDRFIAFQAAVALLKEKGLAEVLQDTYHRCLELKAQHRMEEENLVKAVYAPFTQEEISDKIAQLLSQYLDCELQLIYQRVEDLHAAVPHHTGDWYFTGNFPTPGGNRVTNQAFINYIEGRSDRAY